jgi:hypothetical protein
VAETSEEAHKLSQQKLYSVKKEKNKKRPARNKHQTPRMCAANLRCVEAVGGGSQGGGAAVLPAIRRAQS